MGCAKWAATPMVGVWTEALRVGLLGCRGQPLPSPEALPRGTDQTSRCSHFGRLRNKLSTVRFPNLDRSRFADRQVRLQSVVMQLAGDARLLDRPVDEAELPVGVEERLLTFCQFPGHEILRRKDDRAPLNWRTAPRSSRAQSGPPADWDHYYGELII